MYECSLFAEQVFISTAINLKHPGLLINYDEHTLVHLNFKISIIYISSQDDCGYILPKQQI